MKPAFALDFRDDTITMSHRSGNGWQVVGAVPIDTPDLTEAIRYLRTTALGLSPRGLATKLILPEDQILYITVEAPGPDEESRRAQVIAALEGRTPYDLADLAFDYCGSGPEVKVAVIAKQTLAEAEAFAVGHRLNPVSFVAAPDTSVFDIEPWFGPTAHAATLLTAGDTVERDHESVVAAPMRVFVPPVVEEPVVAEPAAPEEATAEPEAILAAEADAGAAMAEDPAPETEPDPVPEPEVEPVPEVEPAPEVEPEPEVEPAPKPLIPEIVPEPELQPEAVPQELPLDAPEIEPAAPSELPSFDAPELRADPPAEAPVKNNAAGQDRMEQPATLRKMPSLHDEDDRDLIAALSDSLAAPIPQPAPPVVATKPAMPAVPEADEAPMALDVPMEDGGDDDPQGASAIKAALSAKSARVVDPSLTDDLPEAPAPAALMAFASRRQDGDAGSNVPSLGAAKPAAPRPAALKPLAAPVARASTSRPEQAAKPAKPGKSALRGLSAFVAASGGSVAKPRSKVSIPSALPPAKSADAAARSQTMPPRPATARPLTGFAARPPVRGKPRYLGIVMTVVLLFLLAMIAAWSSYSLGAWNFGSDPDPVQVVQADPDPADTSTDVPDPADEMAADLQDPEALADGAAADTASPELAPDAVAADSADTAAPADSAAPDVDLATTAPQPAVLPTPTGPEPAPATTLASEAKQPANPTAGTQDEIFLATMDAPPVAPDPLTLQPPDARGDPLPAVQPAPPPYGTVYQFDAAGKIQPTPEGIITPEGVLLLAGKPKHAPGPRPASVIAAAAAAAAAANPDAAAAALPAALVQDPALVGKKPKLRPEGLAPLATSDQQGSLAPAADSRLAGVQPLPRPAGVESAARQAQQAASAASLTTQGDLANQEAALLASASAIEISRRPMPRPADLSRAVEAAVAAAVLMPEPEPEPIAAPEPDKQASAEADGEPETASAAPRIPTKATVAKQATLKNVINLSKINLIGVYGSQANRYALVRTAAGRYKKVKVGDTIDGGGRVAAITATEVRYQKGGKLVTLAMPKG